MSATNIRGLCTPHSTDLVQLTATGERPLDVTMTAPLISVMECALFVLDDGWNPALVTVPESLLTARQRSITRSHAI